MSRPRGYKADIVTYVGLVRDKASEGTNSNIYVPSYVLSWYLPNQDPLAQVAHKHTHAHTHTHTHTHTHKSQTAVENSTWLACLACKRFRDVLDTLAIPRGWVKEVGGIGVNPFNCGSISESCRTPCGYCGGTGKATEAVRLAAEEGEDIDGACTCARSYGA
jgi:hypothetical protein